MAVKPQMLSDVVRVESRFQRSVNLEKDYAAESDANGYVVTPTARKALRRILEGLEGDGTCRSLTLTGPYGVGKSAFALFMSRLLCSDASTRQAAMEKLGDMEPSLARAFKECAVLEGKPKGLLPVLITARRTPAPLCVLEGMAEALSSERSTKLKRLGTGIREQIEGMKKDEPVDTRHVREALAEVSSTARDVGFPGVLLVIDELGKLFEYAARDSRKGDVYILQELAEQAARSQDAPFVLIGLLHQGFDEYARHLDLATRQEWTKIQGRFTDVAFQEPTEQLVRLIASAIAFKGEKPPPSLSRKIRALAKEATRAGIKPPVLGDAEFEDIACRSYPLHPSALVALPILFNRFAQNERSLFSYLSSLEPNGFQEFIGKHAYDADTPVFIRLPDIFDYFTANFGAGLYRQPHARRWLEAADALDREGELTDVHRQVVKAVGMLSVLNEFSHLRATRDVMAVVLDDQRQLSASAQSAIKDLSDRSLLTYRRFNETYRVWEGSDIDIEERIAEGERKVGRSGLAAVVQKYLVTRPVVARRHSFETGALRYFDLFYVDSADDIELPALHEHRSDGRIIVCLAETSADAAIFRKRAADAGERRDVLFAIPQQIGDLRSAAMELAALRWTWENTPELRDDRVARREVALRITEAEQLLQRNVSGLLDPRPEPVGSSCLWFSQGKQCKVASRGDVSHLLSEVCDDLYKSAPKVRNELVARRSLSSAGAGARRNLVEAMLTSGDRALLGIEGYPPERSMYESFLAATGIHMQSEDGGWEFGPPNGKKSHNLLPCWKILSTLVFDRQPEPIPLDRLFAELASPPVGLMDGLHPLLLCAFMLVHPDETTLYREGGFVPEPSVADFEVLMRRPELFAIAGSRISGGRALVVERLAKGFNVKSATVPVVKALFRMVRGLPEFAWHTRQLPPETLNLRAAFDNAKSPERFLFVEAPEALDVKPFPDGKPETAHIEAFFTALNTNIQTWAAVTPAAICSARDSLLTACGYAASEVGWNELRADAVQVESSVTEPQLLAFIRRLIESTADHQGIESVLALVANRPPHSWSDADVKRFPDLAKSTGALFRSARDAALGVGGKAPIQALSRKDRRDAEVLLDKVRSYVSRSQKRQKPEVLRAVFTALAAELEEAASDG